MDTGAGVGRRGLSALIRGRLGWRRLAWHRRVVAACLASMAVAAGLVALRPPVPPMVSVLVAAGDLSGGHRLATADLAERRLPEGAVPDGALAERRAVIGRTVAAPMRAGEAFTDVRLLGRELLSTYPGRVLAPVRPTDPGVATMVAVGDRVTVLATAVRDPLDPREADARVVASDAPVVTIARPAETGILDESGAELLWVAVTPSVAARLAAASADSHLSLTIAGP